MRSTNNNIFIIEQFICMQGLGEQGMFIETSISYANRTASNISACSNL